MQKRKVSFTFTGKEKSFLLLKLKRESTLASVPLFRPW